MPTCRQLVEDYQLLPLYKSDTSKDAAYHQPTSYSHHLYVSNSQCRTIPASLHNIQNSTVKNES